MRDRFRVVIVSEAGSPFSESFREVAETVTFGLRALGHEATLAINDFDPGATNILFGAHVLSEEAAAALDGRIIVYNLEQVVGESKHIKPVFVDLIRRCTTWDFSPRNIEQWRRYGCGGDLRHVPIGYAPELTRIPTGGEQDIDVLFYGLVNERRAAILQELREAGLRVEVLVGKFGAERDAAIARAKVVLNVHFYRSKIFELVRVSYLLANRKAVVAEVDPDTELDADLREAVRAVSRAELAEACVDLCHDDAARRALEDRGYELFSRRSEKEILSRALSASPDETLRPAEPELPRVMNLGSGRGWNLECLNVDVDAGWRPDIVWDFNQPFPPSKPLDAGRFGVREIPKGYFREIRASHVLEHIRELTTAMESCLELLEEGGTIHVEVPHELSYGAWQNPTHVRAMNERSWLYYTDWFWYLGWSEWRFDTVELLLVFSELGQRLQARGEPKEQIARTPRAVDVMRVSLRKRRLTEQERGLVKNRWRK
jgi:hypothetical protein